MHGVERGSGTPLVLLHGFRADHRLLLPLDPVIAAAGQWRRVYLDLPGRGKTPADDAGSAEDVVTAVEDEIRRRLGSGAFAVLGMSFGGMIGRRVAHDFREQVLGLATIAAVFVADAAAADDVALDRIAQHYGLDSEPEDADPAPFTQPALFITSRQDHVTGYRDAWARVEHYPRSTFAVLDAAGHNAHLDQAAVTAALVTDWLHRVRASASRRLAF